jgi:hypothetical protein
MIVVTEIKKTTLGCPTQWEGKTSDGRYVYARLRFGSFRIGVGRTIEEAVEDDDTFSASFGDGWAGVMTYDELKAITAHLFVMPDAELPGEDDDDAD